MQTLRVHRQAMVVVATLAVAGAWPDPSLADLPKMLTIEDVKAAPYRVVTVDNINVADDIKVTREWSGSICRSRIVHNAQLPVRIKEIVLFDIPHALPLQTHLYGEGFTMLSQTAGTLAKPIDLGLTDRNHYKVPQPSDATVVYGLLTLSTPKHDHHTALAFSSCRRFIGRFYVRPKSIQVVIDTEGLALEPDKTWELEEFMFTAGPNRNGLLALLAERIAANHLPPRPAEVPTGWCSWYCFGPRVKAEQVLANVAAAAKSAPALKYVQIDDGYQPAMGDWLEPGPAFGGGVRDVLRSIKAKGCEPAIWVAPFIAEKDSKLFQQHPDWFIKDADGKPLGADRVTFPGWRRGPWFALDGTHPDVQKHLEQLFRTLREDWGCTYFKLDANFWGAMHGGKFHDPNATRIEAYRRGMQAIRRGAEDCFLLGCNHPIWPSFGLIHGSRSSGDIRRAWQTFTRTARMNLSRNWQNARLWWNDPDCVLLTGELSEAEYLFHCTAIYATGGMILSGDDLTKITAPRLAMLNKLVPPTGVAAEFEDESLRLGYVRLKEGRIAACLLNWDDRPMNVSLKLSQPCKITDFWTGENFGRQEKKFEVNGMPKRSARLLICDPLKP
jgi:alpha-galactosidase